MNIYYAPVSITQNAHGANRKFKRKRRCLRCSPVCCYDGVTSTVVTPNATCAVHCFLNIGQWINGTKSRRVNFSQFDGWS